MPHDYTLAIPFNLTHEELTIDPRDVRDVRSLKEELQWMADNIDGGAECQRIMTCTVLLHDATRHPMNECLRQAAIWERG